MLTDRKTVGSKGYLQDESEFVRTVQSYMDDEFGFKTLDELDSFHANLLEDEKKSNYADKRNIRLIRAVWNRLRLEFIGYEQTVVKDLQAIRDTVVKEEEEEEEEEIAVATAADQIGRRLTC
jgi:hypothetical protein